MHDIGGLKFKQVDNFVKRIQRKITEEDFRRMVRKYDFSNYFKSESQSTLFFRFANWAADDANLMFSKTAFLNLFQRLFDEEPVESIDRLFESLGFQAKTLFSYKSRNFVLSAHSKKKVKVLFLFVYFENDCSPIFASRSNPSFLFEFF